MRQIASTTASSVGGTRWLHTPRRLVEHLDDATTGKPLLLDVERHPNRLAWQSTVTKDDAPHGVTGN